MKLILITDEGLKIVECQKIEPSLKPGYFVIDEDHAVKVENIKCIEEE